MVALSADGMSLIRHLFFQHLHQTPPQVNTFIHTHSHITIITMSLSPGSRLRAQRILYPQQTRSSLVTILTPHSKWMAKTIPTNPNITPSPPPTRSPGSSEKSALSTTEPRIIYGSTYQGGRDPLYDAIIEYGAPAHWVEVLEFRRRHYPFEPCSSPPDPQFYNNLPKRPGIISSGVDIRRERMSGREFWIRVGRAWMDDDDGWGNGRPKLIRGEWRKSVGTMLCEARRREEQRVEDMIRRRRQPGGRRGRGGSNRGQGYVLLTRSNSHYTAYEQ